jgi:hypothetical protein
MKKTVTTIFRGLVSLRDYEVKKCIDNDENMIITFEGDRMTLTPKELKDKRINTSQKYESKIGGKDYYLYGYSWNPDTIEL